jgi:2-polyprenyl-3-methyl-5-hydroxy-6-metoxy-1,4-benzoquinol methylase
MSRRRCPLFRFLLFILLLFLSLGVSAQPPDDEAVWRSFLAWFKMAAVDANPIDGHAAALGAEGVPEAEVKRRLAVVIRLINTRPEFVETYFDKAFARPVSGNPARDGFNPAPSAFLVAAVQGVPAGTALDAGMGQGRNAIELARRGWAVTGFDISGEAIAAAKKNAAAAGVRLDAIKASYADFDFGVSRWDLIVFVFAWAPVDDPAFLDRVRTSLRPGGRVVFEHFVDQPERPRPAAIHALKPGQLRELFKEFRIERYEEVDGVGDWGGPGERIVRLIAVKAQS